MKTFPVLKHRTTMTYGGGEVYLQVLLNSMLVEVSGQLHVPAALPRRKSHLYPFERRLGGMAAAAKRKNSLPLAVINAGHPVRSSVTILTELPLLDLV
jgi:hypothetical protein